jgi:hypothetical protein
VRIEGRMRTAWVALLGLTLAAPAIAICGCKSDREERDEAVRKWEANDLEARGKDAEKRGEALKEYGDEADDKRAEKQGKRLEKQGEGMQKQADELDD